MKFNARDNSTANQQFYFEDADGVARRAMAAYADTTMVDASTSSLAQPITTSPTRIGLPLATANTYAANNAVGTSTQQSQSRPIVLNRPFRSVSEMSYCLHRYTLEKHRFLHARKRLCRLARCFQRG